MKQAAPLTVETGHKMPEPLHRTAGGSQQKKGGNHPMSKTITVWGSPGSGKSMFCCILAKALTRDKQKAIIINADPGTPMLPVWLPEQPAGPEASIGQVLSSVEINTSLIAGHVTVLKNYPFIGLMGYSAGENPLSYPDTDYRMAQQLISAAGSLVDYLILDCSPAMTNVFTPAAIESGDLVIRILTPDLKGVNYLKAHQPLLADGRFRYDRHMTFAGMARPFHAFDEMGYIIGGFDGLLPYGKEIDRCATEGGMFQAVKYCNSKYTASLNRVLDALEQMEAAEREEDWPEAGLPEEDVALGNSGSYTDGPDTDRTDSSYAETQDTYRADSSYMDSQNAYGADSATSEGTYYEDGRFPFHKKKRSQKPPSEDRTVKYSRHQYRNQQEPEQGWDTEYDCPDSNPADSQCEDWEEETDEL